MKTFWKIADIMMQPPLGMYFGVPLQAHWSWVLLIILLAFNPVTLLLMLCVYLFVILHEFGHALTAKYFNIPVEKITIYPIGGIATIALGPDQPKQEFFVTIMGPMVNVALCFICSGLGLLFAAFGRAEAVQYASTLAYINFMLVIFNLAPAYPMDGGRILRSFLAHFMEYRKATWWAVRIGQLTCVGLFVYAVWNDLWLMAVIMPLIALAAQAELRVVENHFELRKLKLIFDLAQAGKYPEAIVATEMLKEEWQISIITTLRICQTTPQPDFSEVQELLSKAYPMEKQVFAAVSRLEISCFRKQSSDLNNILEALEGRKPLDEVEQIVEGMTDEDFKLHCRKLLQDAKQREASSC